LRIGLFGLAQQLFDLEIELGFRGFQLVLVEGAPFGCLRVQFRPIQADRAHLGHLELPGRAEDMRKGVVQQGSVFAAKFADRVVVGVMVGRQVAHREVLVGQRFDLARAEGAGGVAVDEHGQHHRGRILRAAAVAFVDARPRAVELGQGLEDEVSQIILRQPIAQVRRQEHRRRPVDVDEVIVAHRSRYQGRRKISRKTRRGKVRQVAGDRRSVGAV